MFKNRQVEQPLPEPEPDYMGYTMVDEETGMLLSVLMVCGCGNPVVRLGGEESGSFYCEHCDRACFADRPCESCEAHYMFDAEAVKAEFASDFEYDEDEEDD